MITTFLLFITACAPGGFDNTYSNLEEFLENNYRFTDVVQSSANSSDVSRAYVAEDKSIQEVSEEIRAEVPAQEVSELVEGKQAIVYPEHFIILTNDEDNPEHTLVEVASHGFVRDNFSPSFFQGMFLLWVLDDILDVDDWGKKQRKRCLDATGNCYRGYGTTGGMYKGPISTPPTVRNPSATRGGGPGTGK